MNQALTLFTIGMIMFIAAAVGYVNDPAKPYVADALSWKQAVIVAGMLAGSICAVFGGSLAIGAAF